MIIILKSINAKRARYVEQEGGERAVIEKRGEWNLTEMGDRSPLFKYTL
jgi:hypothetical protein